MRSAWGLSVFAAERLSGQSSGLDDGEESTVPKNGDFE